MSKVKVNMSNVDCPIRSNVYLSNSKDRRIIFCILRNNVSLLTSHFLFKIQLLLLVRLVDQTFAVCYEILFCHQLLTFLCYYILPMKYPFFSGNVFSFSFSFCFAKICIYSNDDLEFLVISLELISDVVKII